MITNKLQLYRSSAYSFEKVMRLLVKGFEKLGFKEYREFKNLYQVYYGFGGKLLVVDDTILAQSYLRYMSLKYEVYAWVDSVLHPKYLIRELYMNTVLIHTHPAQALLYGVSNLVVPRPYDHEAVRYVLNTPCDKNMNYVINVYKDYSGYYPRKGYDMYAKLCSDLYEKHGVKCFNISNITIDSAVNIKYGSLTEKELLATIKCAKAFIWTSRAEGFGMPPVEANAVGTPTVCSDAPFNQHVECIRFKTTRVFEENLRYIPYDYVGYDYDYKDLYDAVVQAISMTREEREDFAKRSMEKVRDCSNIEVAKRILNIVAK